MYLKTMETFCKVILLNLSRSITWLIWTKIQVSRARLDSGNNPIKFFIPSIRFCGFEELETFSNWGIRASVSTGSGSSLTYCKYTKIKWLKTILNFLFKLKPWQNKNSYCQTSTFSNLSCMFLNPNNFFQFEF